MKKEKLRKDFFILRYDKADNQTISLSLFFVFFSKYCFLKKQSDYESIPMRQLKSINNICFMPKHQGPIQRLIDPFSIPAQMNNLGVLIVAYVTKDMYDSEVCHEPDDVKFLNFIYYGSTIVCGGTFLMSLIYMVGLLDYCINRVMPCGQVCLTLNTLTIFVAGIIYHCVATVYGLLEMYWGAHSRCVEIEMFKRITCTIYMIWFLCILAYLLFNIFIYNRKKQLQTVEEQYIEM